MRPGRKLAFRSGQIIAIPFSDNRKFVVGVIKSGGMGDVFQLLPLLPVEIPLALKTYQGSADPAEFQSEARIWISLRANPNIAYALSYGELEGTKCVLAKWYDKTLLDLKPKDLPSRTIANIFAGIVSGLCYANDQISLIHRDIKPQNILVDAAMEPKISDFGISKHDALELIGFASFESTLANVHANTGLAGTPLYMAPELFSGSRPTVVTDIFSLGVTMFTWLVGRHPYIEGGRFIGSTFEHHLGLLRTSLKRNDLNLLYQAIALCLALDPARRPQNYRDVLALCGLKRSDLQQEPSVFSHIATAIDTARVLRDQGLCHEAKAMLSGELNLNPADPMLLNSRAMLARFEKDSAVATECLNHAVRVLRQSNGLYHGLPYLDPYLNLGNLYRDDRRFAQAAAVFEEAQGHLIDALLIWAANKEEFAWLELFKGSFDEAANRCLELFSIAGVTERNIAVFILSSYLSGKIGKYAPFAFDRLSQGHFQGRLAVLCVSVLATFLDKNRLYSLRECALDAPARKLLAEMAMRSFGDPEMLTPPLSEQTLQAVLRDIDTLLTGGEFHDRIR